MERDEGGWWRGLEGYARGDVEGVEWSSLRWGWQVGGGGGSRGWA